MKEVLCQQYDELWWSARRGKPSASEAGCLLTPKTLQYAAASKAYIARLIGDTFDLEYPRIDRAVSDAMRRGTEVEPEARAWYSMETGCEVRRVGLLLSDCERFCASPDGACGTEGLLELKVPSPHTHAQWLLDGGLPDDHKSQVHFQLIVSGAHWVDFCAYCQGFPRQLIVRVVPNDYTDKLREALERFWVEYQSALAKIKSL